jgi:ribosomal protein S18 acetylase RimI-like enzyme
VIRAYREADLPQLYEICVRTGAAGQDAYDLVADKKLFGHVFAAQYGMFEPEHAFVVDDGNGLAIGYVLGALDTPAFEAKLEADYWPALQAQYPSPDAVEGLDKMLVSMIHSPSRMHDKITTDYPSHLHIDLLPPAQGGGNGRRMMETCMEALSEDGSKGLHLGVSAQNERALGFYAHLGFEELHVNAYVHVLGVRF